MRLNDILNLEKQPHSLSIIKDFLAQPLSHLDYQAAYYYYFEIAISLSLFDLVYEEGVVVLKEIENQSETLYLEKILKHIIDASIHLSKFEDAKRLIQMRKEVLPMINQYLAILDDINYKKALHEPYLEDVLMVLKDMIPDHVKIYCLDELVDIYMKDHQFDMALLQIHELYQYDLKPDYIAKEIECLIQLERFDEAQTIAQEALKENPYLMDVVLALLHVYVSSKSYVKASNLDAEYETLFEKESLLYQEKVYQLFVELYKQMDNKLSMDLYQKKLKRIKRLQKKNLEQQTTDDKHDKSPVIIIEKPEKKSKVSNQLLEHLEQAIDLIEYAHLIDEKLPLREYLRIFFMQVSQYIDANLMHVYLNDGSPNFFYYKKERLYDKTLTPLLIDDTYVSHVMHTGRELFEVTKTFKWQKDIVTQKPFDESVGFIYAFPMGDLGVFSVYFKEVLTDPAKYYDMLKLVNAIVYAHMLDETRLKHLKMENHLQRQVLNAPILAYRLHQEASSTYNDMAMKLFDIEKHYHLELFLRDVSYEYVHAYKQAIASCLNRPGEIKTLQYVYQNKHIEEKMYSFKEGDETYVMSFFYDQSEEVDKAKTLIEQATIDQSTGLYNKYALDQAMDQLKDDKVSFCLVELDDHMKHIYGIEDMQQFFKEFAQVSKKFFNDAQIYRFDMNQILIALPMNDIRTVTKRIKDYIKHLEGYRSTVLTYEKFDCFIGVLRYPVVTVEKQKEKLYRFFNIAVTKAKRNKDDHIYFFVYQDYEEEVFEQQVIDYLNVAIETRKIGLVFNQIIDLTKNVVWQYESELVITELTIDSKYLLAIAEKRHRLIDLEHFHIERVCEFLVELEKQTERLIKITIPISKKTFIDPKFNVFLLGTLKKYKIPYEFIRLKLDMQLRAKHYQGQIQELIDHGMSIDTTSVDNAIAYPLNAMHITFKNESLKFSAYLKRMKEMFDEFQMALIVRGIKRKSEKELCQRLGINYIEGSLYKEMPAPVLLRKIRESL